MYRSDIPQDRASKFSIRTKISIVVLLAIFLIAIIMFGFFKSKTNSEKVSSLQEENLRTRLDVNDAWEAVEKYGNEYCDSKGVEWELYWQDGKLEERPEDDETWFLKASCKIIVDKAKIDSSCEALVFGTSDNPQIKSFYIYDLQ